MSGIITQDTVRQGIVVRIKTDNLLPDSIFRRLDEKPGFLRNADSARHSNSSSASTEKLVISDTTSVCTRNSIADITFHDSLNFVAGMKNQYYGSLPFGLAGKTKTHSSEHHIEITANLREGIPLQEKPFHNDWIIAFIILASLLFLLVRKTARSSFAEMTGYLLIRGPDDISMRNKSSLFGWQSTILNLVSFIVLGLFVFCAATWYNQIPEKFSPLAVIMVAIGIITLAVMLRHLVCITAGNLSGERDLFIDYMKNIYRSYRLVAIFILLIIILLVYTTFVSPRICFIAGLLILGSFYLYRVMRLFLIFIKKDLSIIYLILYLCALEILPVLILLKYFEHLT